MKSWIYNQALKLSGNENKGKVTISKDGNFAVVVMKTGIHYIPLRVLENTEKVNDGS